LPSQSTFRVAFVGANKNEYNDYKNDNNPSNRVAIEVVLKKEGLKSGSNVLDGLEVESMDWRTNMLEGF
jgi:hypothetical protein